MSNYKCYITPISNMNRDLNKKVPVIKTKIAKNGYLTVCEDIVNGSDDAASIARKFIDDADREMAVVMCLNAERQVISIQEVCLGILTQSYMHPREIFKAAILSNSSQVILVHNHPSGTCEPSEADFVITQNLMKAGQLMGIPVTDHIVIRDKEFISIMEILVNQKDPLALKQNGIEIGVCGYEK